MKTLKEVKPGETVRVIKLNGDGVVNTKDLVLVRKCVASIDPITKEPSFVLGPAA